jgi:hypothetical protein
MSTPFDYAITQIQIDLERAVDLCDKIKKNRKVGPHHKNLDELKDKLSDGPGLVKRLAIDVKGIEGADIDGADGVARAAFAGLMAEVREIGSHLESIAYPPTRHPEHPNCCRSLFFPIYVPSSYKEHREHPHFHDMILKWEKIRDGLTQMFADLKTRLAQKAKDEKDKAEAKKKAEKDEKEAKEKAQKDKEEAVKKEQGKAAALQEKLDKEAKHQEKLREEHEE